MITLGVSENSKNHKLKHPQSKVYYFYMSEGHSHSEAAPHISFEQAKPEDAAILLAIQQKCYLSEYVHPEHGITLEDIQRKNDRLGRDNYLEKMRQRINNPDELWLTAKEGNEIVGFIEAKTGEEEQHISRFFVLPDHQGKGIGSHLMETVLNQMDQKKTIHLQVDQYNQKAIQFYEKFGFQDQGVGNPIRVVNEKTIPTREMVFIHPEKKELKTPEEAAALLKNLAFLIADNQYRRPNQEARESADLYPLHKRQVLEFLKNATNHDLHDLDPNQSWDGEYWNTYADTLSRLADTVNEDKDIANLWLPLRELSKKNPDLSHALGWRVKERADNGEISGEDALRRANIAVDWSSYSSEFVQRKSDTELEQLLEDDLFDQSKEDAFRELKKRGHPLVEEMIALSPQSLADQNIHGGIVGQILAEKLIRGDFESWSESFQVDNEMVNAQGLNAIFYALKVQNIDTSHPTFVSTLLNFNHDRFFSAIQTIASKDKVLHGALIHEADRRLDQFFLNLKSLDTYHRQLIYPEEYISYVCKRFPRKGEQLWSSYLPLFKQHLEENPETFYGGTFIQSYMEGFAPLIARNPELFFELSSLQPVAEEQFSEVRSRIFWQLILLAPDRGQEFMDKFYGHTYKEQVNGVYGLLSTYFNSFNENDRENLFNNPQVQSFMVNLLQSSSVEGSNAVTEIAKKVLREPQYQEALKYIQESLSSIDYSAGEMQFINYFLPDFIEKGEDYLQSKLEVFRAIKERCQLENSKKALRFQYDQEREETFWMNSQVEIASLLVDSPNILEKILQSDMGHTHGYYQLEESLKIFAKVAHITKDEAFLHKFYTVSRGIAPGKLWEFISANYELAEIAEMSVEEMEGIKVFLDSVGNLNIPEYYKVQRQLLKGNIPEHASMLGIKKTGIAGIEQLKNILYTTTENVLLNENFVIDAHNPLHTDVVRAITRFDVSEWKRNKALEQIVNKVEDATKKGLLEIRDGYSREVIEVKRTDVEDDSDFEYTDEAIARFKEIQEDIAWAIPDDHKEDIAIREGKDAIMILISEQQRRIESAIAVDPSLAEKTKIQTTRLSALSEKIGSIKNTTEFFAVLPEIKTSFRKDKIVDRTIRRVILTKFLRQNQQLQGDLHELSNAVPVYETIARLAEFSENSIQEEFIRKKIQGNFTKTLADAFEVKGINLELERYRSYIEYSGMESLLFVPNRKLLGELSGYIADACWTSNDNIMAANANITPVILVKNHSNPKLMRVAGAFLLVEGIDAQTNEKVLIIRGNNPLESTLSQLDAQDYVEKVVEYSRKVGNKKGISKIALPLDGRGQSATNRQSVFDAYTLMYSANQKVQLKGNIMFNGYDLSNRCVEV